MDNDFLPNDSWLPESSAGAARGVSKGQDDPGEDDTRPVAIHVDNLHVHYEAFVNRSDNMLATLAHSLKKRDHRRVEALNGISFTLRKGDALGLIGHNGSGKSTLLQSLAGFLKPSAGSVLVSCQPQILGVQAALNPRLSGRRNIEIGCLVLGFRRSAADRMADQIIEFTELDDFIDLPVQSYSSGMRQRLAFAISTVSHPEILLIDEALAVGDKRFKARGLKRLRDLRSEAGVVVLATHAVSEVSASCNKVLWLDGGHQKMFGDPEVVIPKFNQHNGRATRRITR